MFNLFSKRKPKLEDSLADIVIGLLEKAPDQWKFSGYKADCELMHIKMDFPSWKSLTFQMRDKSHKTFYQDITPTRRKRKELYAAVIRARDTKILAAMTAEVHQQVLFLTDQRKEALEKQPIDLSSKPHTHSTKG